MRDRYRVFLDNIDNACFEVDLAGNMTFFNSAVSRIYGYSEEEFLGMNNRQYTSPETARRIFQEFNEIYRTGVPGIISDYEIFNKDGQARYLNMHVFLIRDDSGKPVGFRAICQDVTDRKKTKEELEKYRNFVENIEDACFEVDLKGNVAFFNNAACRIYGYPREEFLGMNNRQYTSPETAKKAFQEFNEIYRTGVPKFIPDYEIIRKNGQVRILDMFVSLVRDESGKPVGFRGISRDVTDQKKAKEELEKYSVFVENVEDACFETDLKGRLTFCNRAVSRMLGYSKEELIGNSNRLYTSPETRKRAFQIFNAIYRTGVPQQIPDYEIIRRDGQVRYLDMQVSLIRDESGRPTGFRGIDRDITDRKKMEADRERLTEQLYQSQKLEAISTLAGGIAHNFNNLLMVVQGYASLMQAEIPQTDPHYEMLKEIGAQVRKATDLTGQLLGFARGGRYEVMPLNLNELLGEIASLFQMTKKEVTINQTYADSLWTVEANRDQMEQVFMNLFANACQAMPGGGSLRLETKNIVIDGPENESSVLNSGPYAMISVADSGVGMDSETLARVFEPFFTTREMGRRAAGLGLAAAYGIIKAHGGDIRVSSEKGRGSTFTIYLPATEKTITRARPVPDVGMPGGEGDGPDR